MPLGLLAKKEIQDHLERRASRVQRVLKASRAPQDCQAYRGSQENQELGEQQESQELQAPWVSQDQVGTARKEKREMMDPLDHLARQVLQDGRENEAKLV